MRIREDEALKAKREDALKRLLQASTVHRESGQQVDSLIREAVSLGIPQTTVALVAGTTQATVSRLVSPRRQPSAARRRHRRAKAGGSGGTL